MVSDSLVSYFDICFTYPFRSVPRQPEDVQRIAIQSGRGFLPGSDAGTDLIGDNKLPRFAWHLVPTASGYFPMPVSPFAHCPLPIA